MADFRKVNATNQSDTDYQNYGSTSFTDTEFGNLQGAIERQQSSEPIFAEDGSVAQGIRRNAETGETFYTEPSDQTRTTESGGGAGSIEDADSVYQGASGLGGGSSSSGDARENPLDKYANYTYGLSLHYIPISTYNQIASQGGGGYSPGNNVLIASAGRHDQSGFGRRANFKEDFYFENLKLTTIIGYNSRTRGSNVIDVNFTIVEPYGITLLDRLLKLATEEQIQNWNQMPFMLQIDFYGNTDDGEVVQIDEQKKYIPIKVIACNIKASTRGSEYRFSAVPYNHQAFHETVGSSPAFLEVIAGTIGDFFKSEEDGGSSGEVSSFVQERAGIAQRYQQARNEFNDVTGRQRFEDTADAREIQQEDRESRQNPVKVGSYAAALNKFQSLLEENKHVDKADKYIFKIDPEIASAKLVEPKVNNVKSTPMATTNNKSANMSKGLKARNSGGSVPVTLDKQVIPINAGTSIIDVINIAIRNSKYITDQIKEKESTEVSNKPINFYKIIPEIKIGDYDEKRKVFQKTFIYHIKKFSYYNTKYPSADRGIPQKWQKEYKYIYTGENRSILDVNIEFDAMFYTAMTANAKKFKDLDVDATKPEDSKEKAQDNSKDGNISPLQKHYYSAQSWVSTDSVGNNDIKTIGANDLYQSIMSNSRGDMINVKLKITGDPELIKQDDYYSEIGTSIGMDAEEIFAHLSFRSPSDIDQETGMYDFTTYPQSVFSGIYKIIVVDNLFERGQFLQTLDLIRLMEQKESQSPASSSSGADSPASETRSNAENNGQRNSSNIDTGANYPSDARFYRNIETKAPAQQPTDLAAEGQDYLNNLRQIRTRVGNLPAENQFTDDAIWSTGAAP